MYSKYLLLSALLVIGAETYAKNNKTEVVSLSSSYNNSVENNSVDSSSQDSVFKDETLQEVKVVARKSGTSRLAGAVNGIAVNKDELFKAACCNLGESFTTNPSVDVAYNDATTGARQIKLLGLSGTYVQMLTENLPNFRGAAIPYALGYVPGPWMKGIQVSKGSASVKNGYESITGQINVDYLQPEDEQQVEVNLFGDTKSRIEANADANVHLSDKWATEILLHHENILKNHDDNGDGFYDMPGREQYNVQNRWVYKGKNYIFHGGLGALKEIRTSGQDETHVHSDDIYRIKLHTNRYEGYMKHAFILNHEHGTNIAFMSSASMHQLDALYGNRFYDLNEKNLYGSLMFETNFTHQHNLSVGLSVNHDYLGQRANVNVSPRPTVGLEYSPYLLSEMQRMNEKETTPGAYAQYTYTLGTKLTAMAGVRFDHSSLYGNFFTPRFHVKYSPVDAISIRLSAGKGYRTVFGLAEYNYLLASGRNLNIGEDLQQEEAWNYGLSTAFYIPMFGKTLKLNMVSYKTPLGLWQFDATVQLNGGGRNPEPYQLADGSQSWSPRFHSFEQVSAQVTRWFRHWSIYVGGENLTGFKQKTPIYGASNPWGSDFEPTLVWGPVEGRMFYAGVRVHF